MPLFSKFLLDETKEKSPTIIARFPLLKAKQGDPQEVTVTEGQMHHVGMRHKMGVDAEKWERTGIWHQSIESTEDLLKILKCVATFGTVKWSEGLHRYLISWHFPHCLGMELTTKEPLCQATIRMLSDGRLDSFYPNICDISGCIMAWQHAIKSFPPVQETKCLTWHFPDTVEKVSNPKRPSKCSKCSEHLMRI